MVKKMKLKFSFAILLIWLVSFSAHAEVVKCGTNLSTKAYAYKENDQWKGFDADVCRAFAWALYGDGNKTYVRNIVDSVFDTEGKIYKDGNKYNNATSNLV